jgi:mannose-6-phosphate isomerase
MVTIVRGAEKAYGWGIVDGLARWSGVWTGQPQAELWFGAHPAGPSPMIGPDGGPTGHCLDELFGVDEVPLLVKLLAAASPLSVQVHPAAALAERMWLAQQPEPVDPVLADACEKTELIVALEPFEAFVGWRATDDAVAILSEVPAAADAITLLLAGDRRGAIRSLLAIDDRNFSVELLPAAARHAGLGDSECRAYEVVSRTYPGDRGALLTALLQYISLDVGSAIYVPAGVPHSYICGVGLEVMTTSDNVLRLGLTPKPIFVDAALEALDMDRTPEVITAQIGQRISPKGSPFVVTLMSTRQTADRSASGGAAGAATAGTAGTAHLASGAYRLILAIDGSTEVDTGSATVTLPVGSAAILAAGDADAQVTTTGLAALVADRGPTG